MRGLSLIETLVYLGLFSLIITGVIASFINVRSSTERIEASSRLADEGAFVLERVRYMVENGNTVSADGMSSLVGSTASIKDISLLSINNHGLHIFFLLTVPTQSGSPLSAAFSETVFPLHL